MLKKVKVEDDTSKAKTFFIIIIKAHSSNYVHKAHISTSVIMNALESINV